MKMITAIPVPALLALLASSAAAELKDAAVSYDAERGAYQLQWQSEQAVSVAVRMGAENFPIAQNILNQQLLWAADNNQHRYFILTSASGESFTLASRVLPLEGGRNFRDLGGYRAVDGKQVRWGKLFRSGVMHELTARDYGYLDELGIKTVVDLRSSEERQHEPTHWRASRVEHLQWDYPSGDMERQFMQVLSKPEISEQDIATIMADLYVSLVRQQTPHYRAMFERLIADDEPLLFHCTAGKDRTGVGAALLLTALGVDRETVMADYVLTESVLDTSELMQPPEQNDPAAQASFAFFSKLPAPVKDALMGAKPAYLQAAFAEMERQSGSVEAFIRNELGVDDRELLKLRTNYLQ